MAEEATEKVLPAAAHEPKDVSERFIWSAVALLGGSLIASVILVLVLFPGTTTDHSIHLPLPQYPQPELQANPQDDMARFYAAEMRHLNSYGWVDREHGVAHIPIAAAMREVAKGGIAGWPTSAASKP